MTHRRTAEARSCLRRLGAPTAVLLALLLGAQPALASVPDATSEPSDAPRRHVTAPKESGQEARVGVPADADGDDDQAPALSLLPAQQGVLGAGAALNATATIANPGAEALPAGTLRLDIARSALGDRAALDAWLASGDADGDFATLQTAPVDEVGGGASATEELSVAADVAGLEGLAAGVYPLRATLGAGASAVEGRSVVVVADGERAPVSVIVPITAPPTAAGLLTADEIGTLTGPDGALSQALEAVAGTTAVLAVDPAIPAAIRALGTAAPAAALEWLERLEELPNERFALQFGDADVTPQIQAGLAAPLAPTSLRAFESGENFAAPEPTPSATPAAEEEPAAPDEPAYPSLEELLSIGEEAARVYWPAEGSAGPDVVSALAAEGATTLIPSTSTAEGAEGAAVPARAEGALVYDEAISEVLSAAALDQSAHEDDLVEASAELWFAAHETGGAPLLVALDRPAYPADDAEAPTAIRTEESLRDAIESVTRNASVEAVPLTDVLEAEAQPVTVSEVAPEPERTAAVSAFTSAEPGLAHMASALDEPELLTGQARAEALQLLGVGWTDDPDRWREAIGAHAELTAQRVDGIGVTVSDQVQLLSAEAPLPVWVRNSLAWPITVVLEVQPDNVRLDVQERIEVQVPAGSNPRVEIPVEARVGSGEVQLAVSLFTASGEQIGGVQTMDVTVRAEWERIGIAVLVAIIVLLVVGGVIRTVLRRRRRMAERATPDGADADGATADGADGPPAGERDASDD
ncbi:DUF6049 family protein [Microbacterium sp. JZ37]|uniref:DUF6049 family protein n=1 Tax=Microbacterium sp. JZ37 TaxID=2654193 RepID=UPI002B496FE1|nr:DUF6049 family protein [Microbacterium sp. JZ37]WRH18859.1 hypothetical protein GC092_15925 [Microbacterium sp. JZ37]